MKSNNTYICLIIALSEFKLWKANNEGTPKFQLGSAKVLYCQVNAQPTSDSLHAQR